LPWFRRRKSDSDVPAAAVEEAAPLPEPAVVVEEPAAEAASEDPTDPTKPKRRRGSRGGRNRKKPGGADTGDAAERKPAARTSAERKPAEKKQQQTGEKKPAAKKAVSQRQERRRNEPRRRREPQRRAPLPAAKRELIVSVDVGEQRVAVLEDERVAEVYHERPDRRSIAGNI
jgi:hypothetical protein